MLIKYYGTAHFVLLHLAVLIHFVKERHHWVASSYQEVQVKIYDNLFNRKLAPSLEVQLAQLYSPATTGVIVYRSQSVLRHQRTDYA